MPVHGITPNATNLTVSGTYHNLHRYIPRFSWERATIYHHHNLHRYIPRFSWERATIYHHSKVGLTPPMLRLLSDAKISEDYLNPVMLVFIT